MALKKWVFFLQFILQILLITCFCNQGKSQNNTIKGSVHELNSDLPIPYAHIIINDSAHYLSDIDGFFDINYFKPIHKVMVENYLYREKVINHPEDSVKITLTKSHFFSFENSSSQKALGIISQVVQKRKKLNPSLQKNHSYWTYNKTTLSSSRNEDVNQLLDKLRGNIPLKLKSLKEDQHFFILESVTEKKYIDPLHYREDIIGARSSNISLPSIFVQSTQLRNYSIYDNYIDLNGQSYLSPITPGFTEHYEFNHLGEIPLADDTVFIIKFNPKAKERFSALKGILYISKKETAILHFMVSPAQEEKTEIKALQSLRLYEGKQWMFDRTKTQIYSRKNLTELNYLLEGNTYVHDVHLNNSQLKKKDFDEVVLSFTRHSTRQPISLWNKHRMVPLTQKDSSTYKYYNSWTKKKFMHRVLYVAEHLMLGFIPLGKVNIEMNKIIHFNQVESIRVGIGGFTNSKFSDNKILRGYLGYGIKDEKFKYGIGFSLKLEEEKKIWYHVNYQYDLEEAGGVNFAFDRYQYSSEIVRKLRLRILDMTQRLANSITAHPLKYWDVTAFYNISSHAVTYDYQYQNESYAKYNFEEIGLGMRYAFGERIIKILETEKLMVSKFPVFYLQATQGINGIIGNYNYQKIDFKIEQTLHLLNFGITKFQLALGKTFGSVPYNKLYNMKGSLRSFSVVVHNSFETMPNNEFLSSEYMAIFLTHNFGRMSFSNPHFQPAISLLHNTGVGNLAKMDHVLLGTTPKTMQKGYFETGAFAENIYVFKLGAIKIGLGAGVFYRYGPYASGRASENFVFKFATNFLF